MLIIGHRGAAGLEPENTIRSFNKAISLGVNAVELDLRESKDGEIMVVHDRSLKRLFDTRRLVSNLTAVELRKISHNRQIPTLDEVIDQVKVDLVLDIKVHGIEQKVLNIIKNFPHKVLISSFYPEVLQKIRALDGNIDLGLVIGQTELHLLPLINWLTKKVNLYSIHPEKYIVSTETLALLRLSKRKIYVWTVNSQKDKARMQHLGVEAIITDFPQLIKHEGTSI